MKDNWLEKGLKDKLGDHGSSMDLEKAWKALESKRQSPNKKRRFFAWWISGGLLLAGVMGYTFLTMNNADDASHASDGIQIESQIAQDIPGHAAIERTGEAGGSNNRIETSATTVAPNTTGSATTKSTTTESTTTENNPTIALTTRATNTALQNRLTTTTATLNTINTSSFSTPQTTASPPIKRATNEFAIAGISESSPAKATIKKGILPLSPLASRIGGELPVKERLSEFDFPQLATFNAKSILRKIKKPSAQYIGFAAGYGVRSKGKIFAKESPIDAISFQLFYQRPIAKNLYLKTGVNLDQYTNKIEASTKTTYTNVMDNQIIVVNHYQDGRQDKISGTADVEILQTDSYLIYNRYQHLSIPLLLGLEWSLGKKSHLQIEAGLSASLSSRYDIKDVLLGNTSSISPLDNLELNQFGLLHGLYGVEWNYFPFAKGKFGVLVKYRGQFQLNELSGVDGLNVEKFGAQQLGVGLKWGW